jgi:hypothetical protein
VPQLATVAGTQTESETEIRTGIVIETGGIASVRPTEIVSGSVTGDAGTEASLLPEEREETEVEADAEAGVVEEIVIE